MPATLKVSRSKLEDLFAQQVKLAGLPEPEREYKFHPTRRWRLDVFWHDRPILIPTSMGKWRTSMRLAVEIQGGLYAKTSGSHNRGAFMEGEYEKWAEAAMLGIMVLPFGPKQVTNGYALSVVEELLR